MANSIYVPYVSIDTSYGGSEVIPLSFVESNHHKTADNDLLLPAPKRVIMADTSASRLTFWSMFVSNFVLSALSITNLGLISSMVGFILHQKDHVVTYQVNWPGNTVQLATHPKNLWVNQGHESNGVAGYGFFLGLIAMYIAYRQKHRAGKRPSKTLIALFVLQLLAVLFTLSALIFVFLVTSQTNHQHIRESVARSDAPYPEHWWTPENWYKAVLELPLASEQRRRSISSAVTHMVAWRWILVPILVVDVLTFGITTFEMVRQRRVSKQPVFFEEK
ncbi:hypothetical protein N0V90_010484 [Kalmusia sp. IMI 367209]|nr:hypothetical protein N0V90_010484 [Kalmusia sp. IMI 367209]